MLEIKIIQLDVADREHRADRLSRVERILGQIAASGEQPTMIMLPEIWATGFFNFSAYRQESEHLEGETFTRLAPWAEKIGCYLLAGSMVEREGESYYNTTLLVGPNGSLCGSYRKIHLFGYHSEESRILSAGSEIYTLKSRSGTWGFSTCYDLRFPELYRKLNDLGVDIFFVVAAWPLARLEHWLLFSRCRALENLSYLVACNCAGSQGGHAYGGNSLAVNPWGEIIARAGTGEEVLTVTLDLEQVTHIRSTFPALDDRQIR
jgi:predicted amidohydrolase